MAADIKAKELTGSFTAADKTYDGTTSATITDRSVAGKVGSEDVSLTGGTATFDNADVGSGKTVTATGFTLAGADRGNYTLKAGPWTTTASITTKELTVTAQDKSKVLNATNPNFTVSYSGVVNNDNQSVLGGSLRFDTNVPSPEQVGSWTITPSGLTSSNYSIKFATGTLKIQYAAAGTLCLGAPGHEILQPINKASDTDSVFKLGSTVPAKFRVCDANGNSIGTPGVVQSFKLVKTISGTEVATANEDVISTTPDTAFRWSSADQQWIFNINTKNLTSGKTYVYQITLNDGTTIDFQFGIRR